MISSNEITIDHYQNVERKDFERKNLRETFIRILDEHIGKDQAANLEKNKNPKDPDKVLDERKRKKLFDLWREKSRKDTLDDIDKYIESFDETPYLYNIKAYNLAHYFDNTSALEAINKALKLALKFGDPNIFRYYQEKGKILKSQGKYDKAIENFERVIKKSPRYHIAWNWASLGSVYVAKGDYLKAKECFIKNIELKQNNDSYGYIRLVFCLIRLKEYKEALNYLNTENLRFLGEKGSRDKKYREILREKLRKIYGKKGKTIDFEIVNCPVCLDDLLEEFVPSCPQHLICQDCTEEAKARGIECSMCIKT